MFPTDSVGAKTQGRGGFSRICSNITNSLDLSQDPDAFFKIREIQWKCAGLSKSQLNVPVVEKGLKRYE